MNKLSIEEQKELMNEWFDGKYFLEVKPSQYQLFMDFICFYDKRYENYECKEQQNTYYMAWRFCEGLHHHQLEYEKNKDYWKGKLLQFDKVRNYIWELTNTQKVINKASEILMTQEQFDKFKDSIGKTFDIKQ